MRVGVPGTRLLWIPFHCLSLRIPSGKEAIGQRSVTDSNRAKARHCKRDWNKGAGILEMTVLCLV